MLGSQQNAMWLNAQREELRSVQPPWQKNSSSSTSGRQWQAGLEEQRVAWSSSERKVIEAVADCLERCADVNVDFEALERLLEPEEVEVCLRYIFKYATRRGSNIFQLFDTTEKKQHFVASRRRWLEHQGERVALQESWQNQPRENLENAVAAAKVVFIQGRRRSVDFCGRQAQALCRV